MKVKALIVLVLFLSLGGTASADETGVAPERRNLDLSYDYEVGDAPIAGIQRKYFSDNVRVRGWQVGKNLYFGQAKVAGDWGLGFVMEKDGIIYGINNRGVQVLKRF